jgi:hypothetical protein
VKDPGRAVESFADSANPAGIGRFRVSPLLMEICLTQDFSKRNSW